MSRLLFILPLALLTACGGSGNKEGANNSESPPKSSVATQVSSSSIQELGSSSSSISATSSSSNTSTSSSTSTSSEPLSSSSSSVTSSSLSQSSTPAQSSSSSSSSPVVISDCMAGGTGIGINASLPAMPGSGMSHSIPTMMAEHAAALALVAYDDATHAAVNDGNWCNPMTWHNQLVPGDDANVIIPAGRHVTYDQVENSRLHTVRVDGKLTFAPTVSSRMIVDTLVVDPRGTLTIGTKANPVARTARIEIIIADNGNIDVDWDPLLLSRGLVSHGETNIHGATKTPHMKVAIDPQAGDKTLSMSSSPNNWQVGDTLVITGSRFSGWKWDNSIRAVRYHGTQDEVRTITAVSGSQITLDRALSYDHLSPRSDLKISVGNFSRNVAFVTENAAQLPAHRRGHMMIMHSNQADIRYAEFFELGRTDKSRTNMEASTLSSARFDSNVRGRYSFHFHRTGTSDQRNPGIAVGNAVFGSPGWGYVHHDSHAMLHQNVSFNTFGAGFVAETGNETGAWTQNLAIKAEGISGAENPKNNNDISSFDIARSGDAFWFQGRMVASIDNIAASVNRGFTYFHRDKSGTMIGIPPKLFMLPQALGLAGTVGADDIPIRHFHGNEAYASSLGLMVVKANPKQDHDIYTSMTDFTAWEVNAGVDIEYTAHYLLRDFDLIGNTPEPFRNPRLGIEFGNNSTDMVIRDFKIQNFSEGIRLGKHQTNESELGKDQFVVIGGEFISVATQYVERDASDLIIPNNQLVANRFEITLEPQNSAGYYEYLNPATTAGTGVNFHGTKTDSIGSNTLPAGSDALGIGNQDMIALVAEKGYYRTAEGDAYTIVEEYFSDRATGDVHMLGLKTYLGPDVDNILGNQYLSWRDAKYIGLIDLANQAPTAHNDSASTRPETDVTIAVLSNDSDPENNTLRVNGIVDPVHGQVFNNGTSITYRPHIGFRGNDRFHYWATDGQGNFSRAEVIVSVN